MSSKVQFFFSDIQNRKIWCPSRTSNSVAHMMSSIWSQEAVLSIQIWVCSLYTYSMFEHTCSLTWIHVLSYYTYCLRQYLFIRPSSDGTYYGMVMSVRLGLYPSVRFSVSPTLRPGLRPPVFPTFLIHALTCWAEILHMNLFLCTTDQVWVSSHCVNFWRSYASLWT